MSMITVKNLTFSYPSGVDNIFENISFHIDSDWKLGLVGRNGRGKTTLLRLLQGEFEYSGKIISSVRFDYFPYHIPDKSKMTYEIISEVCPLAEDWEFLREISYLDVEAEAMYRPFNTLSNGEQTKVLLAALFLNEGHFLLIDEPTNHLDTDARAAVAAYLDRKKGFILVSHDRRFLDSCIDHILFINKADIEVQKSDFSSWWYGRQQKDASELAADAKLRKEISRLAESGRRSAGWSAAVEKTKSGTRNSGSKPDKGFVGHKAAKMMKRAKSIEARQAKAIEEKSALLKNIERVDDLKIHPLHHHSDLLIEFSGVRVRYDGRYICDPISFQIRQGDRIAIDSKNGSGKSSLIKLIAESETAPDHSGMITTASGLIISYVPQDTGHLKGSLDDYAVENDIDISLFKTILRKLGFERIQFEKNIEDFSAGQKKKVMLAGSLCSKAHVYIWDEPLNYIDVYSRMQIESLIENFTPTMIFVEHDRAFREAVTTKIINL